MRLIFLLSLAMCSIATEFPEIFSSAGDDIYKSMRRYNQIKDLSMYQDRPELIEAFCMDANKTMQKGFLLDKMKDDPEMTFDKVMLKEYAAELRALSKQNNQIMSQLDADVGNLYEQKDFESLKVINEAGFMLSRPMMVDLKTYEENKVIAQQVKILNNRAPKGETKVREQNTSLVSHEIKPEQTQNTSAPVVAKSEATVAKPAHQYKSKEVLFYEDNLVALKEELYLHREDHTSEKVDCLNDITAINYWIIKVLEHENEPCELASAIRQMKSYDKSSAKTCGRDSLHYVEWHGRIKPHVGKKLFEAEAGCHK